MNRRAYEVFELRAQDVWIEKMRRASRVMSERAESCRRMAQTCKANGYDGEHLVQNSRASAYDAAAKTILEILEEKS